MFFDWNGTLLNDLPLVFKSVMEIFKRYSVRPPSKRQYLAEINGDFMKFYWGHGIPPNRSASDLNKIRRGIIFENSIPTSLHQNARRTLSSLERMGFTLALISAEDSALLASETARFHVREKFSLIRGDSRKKTPVIRRALRELDVSPERVLYVGDTVDDVVSARRAGVLTVAFSRGYNSKRRLERAAPSFLIDNLIDVPRIAKRLFLDAGCNLGSKSGRAVSSPCYDDLPRFARSTFLD